MKAWADLMDYKFDRIEINTIQIFDTALRQAKYNEECKEAQKAPPPPVNVTKR